MIMLMWVVAILCTIAGYSRSPVPFAAIIPILLRISWILWKNEGEYPEEYLKVDPSPPVHTLEGITPDLDKMITLGWAKKHKDIDKDFYRD